MDSPQNASFIPKSPVHGSVSRRRVRKVYVLTYLVYVFFVGTLLAAGLTWIYQQAQERKLATAQDQLQKARNSFKPEDLTAVTELDGRMRAAQKMLDQQISIVDLLQAVEKTTVQSVQLSGFTYKKDEGNKLTLSMTARAADFNSALFQRQVLTGNPVLSGATMQNVTYVNTPATQDSPAQQQINFTLEEAVPSSALLTKTTANTGTNDTTANTTAPAGAATTTDTTVVDPTAAATATASTTGTGSNQ